MEKIELFEGIIKEIKFASPPKLVTKSNGIIIETEVCTELTMPTIIPMYEYLY